MRIRVHGHDLPGTTCGPYTDVQVGVQRRREVVELHPGDAASVVWEFDVDTLVRPDATPDVRGPFVHGRPGDRFLYLSWGGADPTGGFTMFRRAKLMLDVVDPALITPDTTLVGVLGLTLPDGTPACAAVRPPRISWSTG
jgi:hypothetical protein